MAANRIDPWFWRHAYMLEFRKENELGGSSVIEAFTFSLPPESEQIAQTQRVNYTKTFGGVVVDDYGNDVFKITLSGSTGNSDLKTIFRGTTKMPTTLSGEDELLYLSKLIENYGKLENLSKKCIYLYDLSKVDIRSLVTTANYWRVNIDNFKYQRDKANPTFYKYTLEMTAYRPEKKYLFGFQNKISGFLKGVTVVCNVVNEIFGTFAAVLDLTTLLVEEVANYESVYDNYENLVAGEISQASNVWPETVKLGDWVQNKVDKYTNQSSTSSDDSDDDSDDDSSESTSSSDVTYNDNNNTNTDFENATEDLKEAAENLTTEIESEIESMSDEQMQALLNSQNISSRDEFESLVDAMLIELNEDVNGIAADAKSLSTIAYYKGTIYYGKKEVTASSTDTFETISLQEYGTTDYADVLATFNPEVEIEPGTTIVVPILQEQDSIVGNEVIKPSTDLDEYGKDIKLDDSGDFNVNYSNGDLKIVESDENITQAIVSRISTEMGARIRDTAYGIRSTIGGNNAITSFLNASIHETVLADPRIDTIESIQFEGNGDKLYYTINFTTKLNESETIRGNV